MSILTYQDALDFLFPLHRFGIKLGLETMETLCKALGNPERRLGKVIHVAGTNGKGSTSSLIASIAKESGEKVALYTSPHLVDFAERIRLNGAPIPQEAVAEYVRFLRPLAESTGATFFEVTTALAFKYFADSGASLSVVEVGMGGRLDATNVVQPHLCVITPIGLDHTEWLGPDIPSIALEKAGIIKPNARTILSHQTLDAMEVLARAAKEKKSKLSIVPAITRVGSATSSIGKMRFHLHTDRQSYYGLETPLWAEYQKENLRTAIVVAEQMNFSEAAIRNGVLHVIENSGLRGRLEVVSRDPLTILDVSHNPHGVEATVEALKKHRQEFERLLVVFGAMRDKDAKGMLLKLGELASSFFFATPQTERALDAQSLENLSCELRLNGKACGSTANALSAAKSAAQRSDLILITGSFYLAGEALSAFPAQLQGA
ncbi:MAG: bifunctional folylpolyglutamate synthase/dihydrofolate synthase [Chloroherpetonaceae bacterium]|nr:bifunctional folylpolyglutamate synthase/dihydrofolate synthase [Chloroherpetonaceae bacterium]MDW8437180.1 folylpolyglutamate synthase/dihydrofolate synthase family protein [Chloroherpetonaceae bacterium]